MENIDIIDSSGDVILILHREEDEPDLKLKVNSKILSLASPIFHYMFDGRFAEGQNLSSATPNEILLPSDKADLMQMLCLLVHFRCSRLPRTVDIETLADFALLCDKYQCIEAAGWMSRGWVTSWLSHPKTANFEKLLFVTYVLGLPDEFNQVTRLLILNYTFDLDIGSAMHGFDFLPGQIFTHLQNLSIKSFNLVASQIDNQASRKVLQGDWNHVLKGSHNICSWMKSLISAGLWPPEAMSIQNYRTNFMSVPDCYAGEKLIIATRPILQAMNQVIYNIKGLDLETIK